MSSRVRLAYFELLASRRDGATDGDAVCVAEEGLAAARQRWSQRPPASPGVRRVGAAGGARVAAASAPRLRERRPGVRLRRRPPGPADAGAGATDVRRCWGTCGGR